MKDVKFSNHWVNDAFTPGMFVSCLVNLCHSSPISSTNINASNKCYITSDPTAHNQVNTLIDSVVFYSGGEIKLDW